MREPKKEYLSLYLLQNAAIKRLTEQTSCNASEEAARLKKLDKAYKTRDDIEKRISEVGGVLSELLYLKYVCGKPLLEISFIINYSPRHTERLHRKALEKLKLPDNIK